jgi:hypothetical protein
MELFLALKINSKKKKNLSYPTGPSPKARPSLPPPAAGPAAAHAEPIWAKGHRPGLRDRRPATTLVLGVHATPRRPYKAAAEAPPSRLALLLRRRLARQHAVATALLKSSRTARTRRRWPSNTGLFYSRPTPVSARCVSPRLPLSIPCCSEHLRLSMAGLLCAWGRRWQLCT